MRIVKAIWLDTRGATAMEYGIFIAAIAVPALVSLNFFGKTLSETLANVSTTIRSNH